MNKEEVIKAAHIGKSKEQRNAVVCALVGHSRIVSYCMWYLYCGRCGAQVGDTLGGSATAKENVIIGHDCDTCRKNMKNMTWKDTLYCEPHGITKEIKT